MSFGVLAAGVSGAAAGANRTGQGIRDQQDAQIRRDDADIRQAAEGRNVKKFDWWQGFANQFGKRELLESADTWRNYTQGYQPTGGVTSKPSVFNSPQANGALPGAAEGGQPPAPLSGPWQQQLPGAAEGGPMSIAPPPQPAGPWQREGLPASAPAQQAPAQQAPAQQKMPSRRERYKEWYDETAKYAALNGGLEGYQKFQEMEDATSRKQVMGYGLQAIRAMNEGNVGEAMRAGNAALEVTPFDTGLKFEAIDGELRMVGADGKPGEPLKAEHLQAFVDDHMKTPEQYLNWKKQYETERKNLVDEGVAAGTLAVNERIASVNESAEARAEKFGEREQQRKEATVLAQLITAKTAQERAAAALAAKSNWTPAQQLQIYKDADTWALDDAFIPEEIQTAFNDDDIAWGQHKSDVMNQMTNNPYDAGPTREEAAHISWFLRQPGGVNLGNKMNVRAAQDPKTGAVIVDYSGKRWELPYDLGAAALDLGIIKNPVEPPTDATAPFAPTTSTPPGAPTNADPAAVIDTEIAPGGGEVLPTGTAGERRAAAGSNKYGFNPDYFDTAAYVLKGGKQGRGNR